MASKGLIGEAEEAYKAACYQETIQICYKLHSNTPTDARALLLLGLAMAKSGQTEEGFDLIHEALTLDVESGENALVSDLQRTWKGEETAAFCKQRANSEPKSSRAQDTLGLVLLMQRHLPQAIACFERAIALDAKRPSFHVHLGLTRQATGRRDKAMSAYKKALAIDPKHVAANLRLGQLLTTENKIDEAITYYKNTPGSSQSHMLLATAYLQLDQVVEAEEHLRKVIEIDPDLAIAHGMLGQRLKQSGHFDEAVASFQKAICLEPKTAEPYFGIVSCKKCTEDDRAFIQEIHTILEKSVLTNEDRQIFHATLGKAYDDLGEYETAMQHFQESNRLEGQLQQSIAKPFSPTEYAKVFDRYITTFTEKFFHEHSDIGSDSEVPVFIVGMPRSGTTLVEQIVSSHPNVTAAGELKYWTKTVATIFRHDPSQALSPTKATRVVKDYLKELHEVDPDALRVTDKMPLNYGVVGFIHLLLPKAQFIHIKRHPVDNCLSMFMTRSGIAAAYGNKPENIVFAYEQYHKLMEHWVRVLPPDRILEVQYEEIVENRERVTKEMIAFCGLDWDEACLDYASNDRIVRTPSTWQVRQPIYKTSVARWRRYEPWLGAFRELLTAEEKAELSRNK